MQAVRIPGCRRERCATAAPAAPHGTSASWQPLPPRLAFCLLLDEAKHKVDWQGAAAGLALPQVCRQGRGCPGSRARWQEGVRRQNITSYPRPSGVGQRRKLPPFCTSPHWQLPARLNPACPPASLPPAPGHRWMAAKSMFGSEWSATKSWPHSVAQAVSGWPGLKGTEELRAGAGGCRRPKWAGRQAGG